MDANVPIGNQILTSLAKGLKLDVSKIQTRLMRSS